MVVQVPYQVVWGSSACPGCRSEIPSCQVNKWDGATAPPACANGAVVQGGEGGAARAAGADKPSAGCGGGPCR